MKEIKGYLIDRTTGVGIPGKAVTFKDLAGTDIATGTHGTVRQEKDSVTQSDGSFKFRCELSPGPIQIAVDVSGSEKKARKWDEKAQMGLQWSSDISRVGRGLGNGVIKGFFSDLALSLGSGHNFRINQGAAIIDGVVWSIEDVPGGTFYEIAGTSNPGGSGLNPRLDLVSLRQYKESAAGQLSGKQDVVVTLGTTTNVVPAIPTGADFTALPIGVLSTAEGAATKTIYTNHPYPSKVGGGKAPHITRLQGSGSISVTTSYATIQSIVVSNLDPTRTYDGELVLQYPIVQLTDLAPSTDLLMDITSPYAFGGIQTDVFIRQFFASLDGSVNESLSFTIPIVGVSAVSGFTYDIRLKRVSGVNPLIGRWDHFLILRPRP